jgi:hypothetical protein
LVNATAPVQAGNGSGSSTPGSLVNATALVQAGSSGSTSG